MTGPDRIRLRVEPTPELPLAPLRVQRAAVVAALRCQPGSRSDLTRRLGLSASAMTRIAQGLLGDGWLVEAGMEPVAVGRPKKILAINPGVGHVITVVLGAGTMEVRIVDAAGVPRLERQRGLPVPTPVAAILDGIDELVAAAGVASRTLAVGFSAPGVVGADGAVIHAPDLGWDEPVALGAMARGRFACGVTVANDVNLMMLAEALSGAAVGVSHAAFLYHGVGGIGLGILRDGVIHAGAHGAAGEIGLIPTRLAEPGDHPALFENSYSVAAIAERLTAIGVGDVSAPMAALVRAAQEGRDGGLLDELDTVIGRSLGVVALLLDPELIVIGRGLQGVLGARLDRLRAGLEGWVPVPPRIEWSQLGPRGLQLAVQTNCWDGLLQEEL